MSRFQNINDVWEYLNAIPMFQNVGVSAANFSLDNIRQFCENMGDPQDEYPVVHIGGTNGKGTTAFLLEHIYKNGGYKTGLFTSPHLIRYNERVRCNGLEISDDEILAFFQKHEVLLEEIKLSYFEISTALAFWFFAQQKVEIAFIEVGLGGRLDSTNIVDPEVSVITSIGLDHQNVLGDTIAEIAREKAGIIKMNKPVIMGNVDEEAYSQIEAIAREKNSSIYSVQDLNPEWSDGNFILKDKGIKLQSLLYEAVNKWNVGCAWLVWQILNDTFPITEQEVLKAVKSFKGVAGRFEKLHNDYNWYFSGSHNLQALDSSMQAIRQLESESRSVVVFSAVKDKVSSDFLERFKFFKKKYFVEQKGERAAKLKDIRQHLDVQEMDENNAQIILNELKSELVIFTGSFYFYPIVKRWITKL